MAIKTFTANSVLTAADTNTYLANSGLVYVTSATVGTAVSSVTVSSAFSSTYDNYKIIYTGGTASAVNNIGLKMGSTTTGYYGVLFYSFPNSAAFNGLGVNNGANWLYVGDGNTNGARLSCELYGPNLAIRTGIAVPYMGMDTALGAFGNFNGNLADTTQYTAFTLIPNAGTLTGGTITVYGYRKA